MIRLALIAWLALCGVAHAQLAGGLMFPGPGMPASAGASYTGPGDVFSTSVIAAYSCAQAYNAAYATALGNACDLVDSAAPTTVICTLKFLATGKVDLATASCTGSVAPPAKCAAATGGVCNISKVYDQSGNGRDVVQVTAANQPTITFSSTPTGALPAINCGVAAGNRSLQTVGNITQAQPIAIATVMMRASDFTSTGSAIGGPSGGLYGLGSFNTTNTVAANGGVNVTKTASDSVWHAVSGLLNGGPSSSAINVDGSDATGDGGTNSWSAAGIRLCRGNALQYPGLIAEAIVWGASTTPTNRNDLSTNAHSANRYNF